VDRKLAATRRIHKICKGWQVVKRNQNVQEIKENAKEWVIDNKDKVDGKRRGDLIKLLAEEFKIPMKDAKVLVTNLKLRKVVKEEKQKLTVIVTKTKK
jgi:hypothetical protein